MFSFDRLQMRNAGRSERGNANDVVTKISIYKMCLVDGRSGAPRQSPGRQADQTSRDKRRGKKEIDEVTRIVTAAPSVPSGTYSTSSARPSESRRTDLSLADGINRRGCLLPSRCGRDARTKDPLNRDTSENVSLPRKLRCRRFRTHPASLDIIAVN